MKYELASGKSKHKGNTLFSCADTTGTPMIDYGSWAGNYFMNLYRVDTMGLYIFSHQR